MELADGAEAEAVTGLLERAVAAADELDAKYWKLRAATPLARLWRDQGRADEARALLAPLYGWFSEGLDSPDLVAAKTLLDELA